MSSLANVSGIPNELIVTWSDVEGRSSGDRFDRVTWVIADGDLSFVDCTDCCGDLVRCEELAAEQGKDLEDCSNLYPCPPNLSPKMDSADLCLSGRSGACNRGETEPRDQSS